MGTCSICRTFTVAGRSALSCSANIRQMCRECTSNAYLLNATFSGPAVSDKLVTMSVDLFIGLARQRY